MNTPHPELRPLREGERSNLGDFVKLRDGSGRVVPCNEADCGEVFDNDVGFYFRPFPQAPEGTPEPKMLSQIPQDELFALHQACLNHDPAPQAPESTSPKAPTIGATITFAEAISRVENLYQEFARSKKGGCATVVLRRTEIYDLRLACIALNATRIAMGTVVASERSRSKQVKEAQAEKAALLGVLAEVFDIICEAPEINMSNYNPADVEALNGGMVKAFEYLDGVREKLGFARNPPEALESPALVKLTQSKAGA